MDTARSGVLPRAEGDGPFRGADQLMVFVPAASWSLYRDGAGCEENPWEHWLGRIMAF